MTFLKLRPFFLRTESSCGWFRSFFPLNLEIYTVWARMGVIKLSDHKTQTWEQRLVKPKLEKSLEELEKLVEKLEDRSSSLNDSLSLFEKGVSLYKDCKKELDQAEKKISKLTESLKEEVLED